MRNLLLRSMVAAALLAIALVLTVFLDGVGGIVPMLALGQFLVLLCGLLCGPGPGAVMGLLLPLLSTLFLDAGSIFPEGVIQGLELMSFGLLAGFMLQLLDNSFGALLAAMIGGRAVLALASMICLGIAGRSYSFDAFFQQAVMGIWPGILLQLVAIPVLMFVLKRSGVRRALQE